ncbi:MAG: zf-HC2 domain-containing protein [Cytophagales bacterium]|nr:zf-HC2 domain-containing protein [Armatimonadota bacterium]
MDCKNWRERASDYIEGALETSETAATREAMRRHADQCAACRADESALRLLSRELNVLPAAEPPLFFRENLLAAIERGDHGAKRPSAKPFWGWQSLLPSLGRTAFGTLIAGGACAAVLWSIAFPRTGADAGSYVVGGPLAGLLPGLAGDTGDPSHVSDPETEAARLRIGRVTTILPVDGPVYDFSLWLENADKGTARFQLIGDKRAYRFNLGSGMAPQTLRVPLAAAQGGSTINLGVHWTADGKSHEKQLFVPVPRTDDRAPERKQSFGLPETTLLSAAKEIAARYGTPVTLEDLTADVVGERIMVNARHETASETLRRNLAGRGLKVTVSGAGVLVTPQEESAR